MILPLQYRIIFFWINYRILFSWLEMKSVSVHSHLQKMPIMQNTSFLHVENSFLTSKAKIFKRQADNNLWEIYWLTRNYCNMAIAILINTIFILY